MNFPFRRLQKCFFTVSQVRIPKFRLYTEESLARIPEMSCLSYACWLIISITVTISASTQENESHANPRQLDPISGGDVLRRYADSKLSRSFSNSGGDVIRSLLTTRTLDHLSGGELVRALNPLSGGLIARSLDRLSGGELVRSLDQMKGGELLAVLDQLTNGNILKSLDSVDADDVLAVLQRARSPAGLRISPKRTLDTLSGMAFGENKRLDSLSGMSFGLSKRNFDEIDNVGFNGFLKRNYWTGPGRNYLKSLAKKNFDEIDRAGFGTFVKRDFDEIDRAGFEGFEKKDMKNNAKF